MRTPRRAAPPAARVPRGAPRAIVHSSKISILIAYMYTAPRATRVSTYAVLHLRFPCERFFPFGWAASKRGLPRRAPIGGSPRPELLKTIDSDHRVGVSTRAERLMMGSVLRLRHTHPHSDARQDSVGSGSGRVTSRVGGVDGRCGRAPRDYHEPEGVYEPACKSPESFMATVS